MSAHSRAMHLRTAFTLLALSAFVDACAKNESSKAAPDSSASATPPVAPAASSVALPAVPPIPTEPAVDLSSEPSHHSAVENPYTHTFKVEVASGGATLRHRHDHDYVAVMIGATELSNEVDGKAPVSVKFQDGQVRFTPGGTAHLVRNLAGTTFRNVTIELLQDEMARQHPPPAWDQESGALTFKGGSGEITFVKDGVRVSSITLEPGGAPPKRPHPGPELVVAVSDLTLGKGASAVELTAGDAKWFEHGLPAHSANQGKEDAKLVLLEFREAKSTP